MIIFIIGTLAIFAFLLPASYFIVGWFVRKCANRKVRADTGEKDKDGKPIYEWKPKPLFWYFQPENTIAFHQYKGNDNEPVGVGSKATPASGSSILYVTHDVPGKILDASNPDKNYWCLRDLKKGERETSRRGLFYRLYGVHTLGFFKELRTVTIREVRLSIDEQELKDYAKAIAEWERGGRKGDRPKSPTYQEHVKSYETLFPYYTREHGVAIREAETAGAFKLDIYTNLKYEEKYPVRAHISVADSNAILAEFVQQYVIGETQGHEPEYFLYEKLVNEQSNFKLKDRRAEFVKNVQDGVAKDAEEVIGLSVKKFIVYSIDMEDKQRELLELQEKTEREEQARILQAKREAEVAKHEADQAIARARGEAEAIKLRNEAQADHVQKVILPIAEKPNGAAVLVAENLGKLEKLTHLTYAPGTNKVVPIGEEAA